MRFGSIIMKGTWIRKVNNVKVMDSGSKMEVYTVWVDDVERHRGEGFSVARG